MPQSWEVEVNGHTYEVEAPDMQAAVAAVQRMPTPEPSHAPKKSDWPTTDYIQKQVDGGWKGTQIAQHPGQTLAVLGSMAAVPGILGLASKGGPMLQAGARAASKTLDNPVVGGTIGAVEGGRRGGIEGAFYGGLAGVAGTSALARGLKRFGGAPVEPPVAPVTAAPAAAPPAPSAAAKSPSESMVAELMKRIENPDWRTADAVPVDAMSRKGILEPGESRVGLAERAAAASKTDAAEAERLLKALRQRMHISGKTTK